MRYHKALCLIVLGLVLAANEYWAWANGWYLLSALLVIGGIVKLFMPPCKCQEKAAPKKKR
jgi:uncharacterized membrane protein